LQKALPTEYQAGCTIIKKGETNEHTGRKDPGCGSSNTRGTVFDTVHQELVSKRKEQGRMNPPKIIHSCAIAVGAASGSLIAVMLVQLAASPLLDFPLQDKYEQLTVPACMAGIAALGLLLEAERWARLIQRRRKDP
jgi:hypothetical protein